MLKLGDRRCTTYLTNSTRAPDPYNSIEVWLNGTKQAVFFRDKLKLYSDLALEFAATDANIRCPHNLTLALATNGQIATFAVTADGTEMLSMFPGNATTIGKLSLTEAKLTLNSLNPGNRVIDTSVGSIEVAGTEDVLLRVNAKNNQPNSTLRILDYTTELATLDSASAIINVDTTVDADLTVSGTAALDGGLTISGGATVNGGLTVPGTATFGGTVDAHNGGIRTKAVPDIPLFGFAGDIYVDTVHERPVVGVGDNTWKTVALT